MEILLVLTGCAAAALIWTLLISLPRKRSISTGRYRFLAASLVVLGLYAGFASFIGLLMFGGGVKSLSILVFYICHPLLVAACLASFAALHTIRTDARCTRALMIRAQLPVYVVITIGLALLYEAVTNS